MINERNFSEISRIVSHALRHEPWVYELALDSEGWVQVETLLLALRTEQQKWANLCANDLVEMIGQSGKKRHEIRDGRIRALYGHSVPEKLRNTPAEPPAALYHGTAPETVVKIKEEGLKSMDRQYVHLSIDTEMALQVGRRKSLRPVILKVTALSAWRAGVKFYTGNDRIWLADMVPAVFVTACTAE
ncbi:MAG: RNA 2'-phosphotransferase [Nevskia sp.]|nr:RNA 2'-phosphotransferase [Nevskia sp.]